MRRNVASQVVGAQMVSATDGSAFTGEVTCSVTGDGGTQATGSVGSGACTHQGNGFHTYTPSQAETNYAHVAYTFTGSGAIPVTVQIYPMSYDSSGVVSANLTQISGDSTAADNLELAFDDTAGSVPHMGIIDQGTAQSATSTTLVLRSGAAFADDELIGATIVITGGSAGAGQARLITDYVSSTATATVAAWATTPTGTITYKIYATAPGSSGSGATAQEVWEYATRTLTDLDAAGIRSAVGLASANLDTQLAALPTAAENADAVWDEAQSGHQSEGTFGAYLDSSVSGVSTGGVSAADIADAVWDEALSDHADAGSAGEALSSAASGGGLDAAGVRAALGMASADLDTQLDAIKADTAATLVDTGTTLPAQIGALNDLDATEVQAAAAAALTAYDPPTNAEMEARTLASADYLTADDVLDEVVEGTTTLRESVRLANAVLGGKASGLGTSTATFRDLADSKDRVTATVDADGNRATVTRDLT